MSIIDKTLQIEIDKQKGQVVNGEAAVYNPSEEAKKIRAMVIFHFALGYNTMYKPRVEFNDLSTLGRDQTDFLAWNTYQPNNGDPFPGDQINGWRSNALRPIERNKAVSIAAHATSQLLFPKIFAFDQDSDKQAEAASVMESLMEWTAERSNYPYTFLQAVVQALVSPASILHTEYVEVYRKVKREILPDGTYHMEEILDETLSGFQRTVVRTDQLYIENFFEPDIQKQGWLVWRRVQDHRLMELKYGYLEDFKHVKPGMQVLFNDANQGFYYVYDPNMRQYEDEEVIYWNKSMDLMLVMVNGILVTRPDNANPRLDKMYPFAKFGYELINNTCFYYKSLVFKMSHDANIINTIYPMVIDGTYLNLMPPFLNQGGEMIASDVIVPGQVTTLSSPDSQLTPIKIATDLKSGLDVLMKVEESISQTSDVAPGEGGGAKTAYEVSKREQNRQVELGLFIQMIGSFIKQLGPLWVNEILQNLTIAQIDKITDNPELVYKSFLVETKEKTSTAKHRKIKFDDSMPDEPISADALLEESFDTLKLQGGIDVDVEVYRVNPRLLRDLKYMTVCTPDVLNPRSEDVERMYSLELYDRAIKDPSANPEEVYKDFLLSTNPKAARHPDKYVKKQPEPGQAPPPGMPQAGAPPQPQPMMQ